MELTEDEIIQKYGKRWGIVTEILPYEYEYTCFSCGFNLIDKNTNSLKYNEKKNKFFESLRIC